MAWPLSRRTSYVSGTTPAIKAADENAYQDAIIAIFGGTLTLKSLYVDGTGANVVTSDLGALRCTANKTETGLPTAAQAWGSMGADDVPFGKASVNANGTFNHGKNVESVTRTGAGVYEVVFKGQPPNIGRTYASLSLRFNGAPLFAEVNTIAADMTNTKATIFVWDATGNAINGRFDLIVYGG